MDVKQAEELSVNVAKLAIALNISVEDAARLAWMIVYLHIGLFTNA